MEARTTKRLRRTEPCEAYRPRIEHTYRFDQEEGLDVEDMRVQTLERMRRLFALVLMAALFVYHVAHLWPQQMVPWLRRLGGKLGLASDLDGPYLLLAGHAALDQIKDSW